MEIIIGFLVVIFILSVLSIFGFIKNKNKNKRSEKENTDWEKWQVNDLLVLNESSSVYELSKQRCVTKLPLAVLVKWDKQNALIRLFQGNEEYFVHFSEIKTNSTHTQRIKIKSFDEHLKSIGQDNKKVNLKFYDEHFFSKQKTNKEANNNMTVSKNDHVIKFCEEYDIVKNNEGKILIGGKPLSSLNETELKIYLNLTIKNEAFEISEEIKMELRKFEE